MKTNSDESVCAKNVHIEINYSCGRFKRADIIADRIARLGFRVCTPVVVGGYFSPNSETWSPLSGLNAQCRAVVETPGIGTVVADEKMTTMIPLTNLINALAKSKENK